MEVVCRRGECWCGGSEHRALTYCLEELPHEIADDVGRQLAVEREEVAAFEVLGREVEVDRVADEATVDHVVLGGGGRADEGVAEADDARVVDAAEETDLANDAPPRVSSAKGVSDSFQSDKLPRVCVLREANLRVLSARGGNLGRRDIISSAALLAARARLGPRARA